MIYLLPLVLHVGRSRLAACQTRCHAYTRQTIAQASRAICDILATNVGIVRKACRWGGHSHHEIARAITKATMPMTMSRTVAVPVKWRSMWGICPGYACLRSLRLPCVARPDATSARCASLAVHPFKTSAIPAEGLSVNGLWAVWPSIVLYGRSARNPIEQDRSFMRPCSPTLGVVIPRHE
jgi:hypothetical protein